MSESNPHSARDWGAYEGDEGHPGFGATAFLVACELPAAAGASVDDMAGIYTDEWESDGERWGISLNGSGADRLWYGPLYNMPTDREFAVRHPAGTSVVGLEDQALAVLKPDGNEYFCEPDSVPIWQKAICWEMHDRVTGLGKDLPPVRELIATADEVSDDV